MDLKDILFAKALFLGNGGGAAEGGGGAKVAIWNGEADLPDGEMVKFSDESPTVEELQSGYLLIDVLGKYGALPLNGTHEDLTLYENQGAIAIMWENQALFAVATEELEELMGLDSGIYRSAECKTGFTDKPMMLVW